MGLCWYCHWGWAEPVAQIFRESVAALDGDDTPLCYGPGHVVWADENFETDVVKHCLLDAENQAHYSSDVPAATMAVVKRSLERLLEVPESVRCCEPPDYDGEHPENFPPQVAVSKDH